MINCDENQKFLRLTMRSQQKFVITIKAKPFRTVLWQMVLRHIANMEVGAIVEGEGLDGLRPRIDWLGGLLGREKRG
jgi:hypothetical protein